MSKKTSKNNSYKGSRKVGKSTKKTSRKSKPRSKRKTKSKAKAKKDLSTTEEFRQLLDEDVSEQQPIVNNRQNNNPLGFNNFSINNQFSENQGGVEVNPEISPFANQALGKEFNYDFGDLYERHQQNTMQAQPNQSFISQNQASQMMGQQAAMSPQMMGQQAAMSPQMMGQQAAMSPQMMGQQAAMSPQMMGQQAAMSPQMMGQQAAMSPQIMGQEQLPSQGSDLSSLFSSLGNLSNSNILV